MHMLSPGEELPRGDKLAGKVVITLAKEKRAKNYQK